MRKALIIIALTVLMVVSCLAIEPESLIGIWNGTLHVQGISLRLAFNIVDSSGAPVTTIDSPDQGVTDIPTDSTIVIDDTLRIVAAALLAEYVGVIDNEALRIKGTWFQAGQTFPLDWKKEAKLS